MYCVEDVAEWFILNVENVTNKKLQKLVYYAYSWYLTLFNEDKNHLENRLFSVKCEAWIHGPVVPQLYSKYKKYYSNVIPVDSKGEKNFEFSEDVLDLLMQIKDVYGKYNGNQLESISHQEEPWINARKDCTPNEICSNTIDDITIFEFYSKRL